MKGWRLRTLDEVVSHFAVDEATGCHNWTGPLDAYGYGRASFQAKGHKAHRLAYEAARGPIPEGLEMDHLCRNRRCINPDHLEPVTRSENLRRGNGPAAQNARKTHCKHGHEFTAENTRQVAKGRRCATCARIARRARTLLARSGPAVLAAKLTGVI